MRSGTLEMMLLENPSMGINSIVQTTAIAMRRNMLYDDQRRVKRRASARPAERSGANLNAVLAMCIGDICSVK
jgi:hypothetical protein